ncbi:hypothetical protein HDU82_006670, partial [Entophlyctis luteolus]
MPQPPIDTSNLYRGEEFLTGSPKTFDGVTEPKANASKPTGSHPPSITHAASNADKLDD